MNRASFKNTAKRQLTYAARNNEQEDIKEEEDDDYYDDIDADRGTGTNIGGDIEEESQEQSPMLSSASKQLAEMQKTAHLPLTPSMIMGEEGSYD